VEKARLLHELFPKEMPLLLRDIQQYCRDVEENQLEYLGEWKQGAETFNHWLLMCQETAHTIAQLWFELQKSPIVFCEQLFYYTGPFVKDRILAYSKEASLD
jgi:hypothetical protein